MSSFSSSSSSSYSSSSASSYSSSSSSSSSSSYSSSSSLLDDEVDVVVFLVLLVFALFIFVVVEERLVEEGGTTVRSRLGKRVRRIGRGVVVVVVTLVLRVRGGGELEQLTDRGGDRPTGRGDAANRVAEVLELEPVGVLAWQLDALDAEHAPGTAQTREALRVGESGSEVEETDRREQHRGHTDADPQPASLDLVCFFVLVVAG